MKKYQAYKPTKWEERIDKAFGLLSPKTALNRMVARERANWFRYLAAQPTTARKNSPSTSAGEWLKIQREKLQVMWNAINMVSNSGLCTGILTKFPTYVCGSLGWQARTGNKTYNEMYQNYIKAKTGKPANIDITRRHSLRQMCMLDIKCIALKGDIGTNIVRGEDGELYLQGIEADRIGDPYRWDTSDKYVRGLVLDDMGGIEAVRVYHQDRRSGTYKYDATFPTRDPNGLPNFLFFNNPIDFDNYRGISLFQHAIDNSTYIDRMRQYELQALLWASSQSGVYYTKSGGLPEALPFSRTPIVDNQGNVIDTYEARPNTISALSSDGEKIEMFQHDRPSPNVIGMYENTVRDIAIGAGLTYGFCYDMTGMTGPAVRQCSAQDARAIFVWQQMLREQKLDPVIMLLLGTAIANGELPYIDTWMLWDWFFPPKPTIDVGRESDANIQEINSAVNTGANVVAEAGLGDVQDVITQRGHEVEMQIEAAMEVAERLGLDWKEVHTFMVPPPRGSGKGGAMAAAQGAANLLKSGMNGDREGATDDGISLDEDSGKRFSDTGDRPIAIHQHFYRPDQTRDEGGKWVDEGKGSQEPGYVRPGEEAKGGVAVKEAPPATQKKTEQVSITTDTVEQHRGGVKSAELAKHKDDIEGAFNKTLDTKVVPTHSLISNKNEQLDPMFVSGEKPDPRQRATSRMLEAISGSGPKRDPLDVHDNMDGTFTIKDGNATSQAAMLAGWSRLPVRVTSESPEPEMSEIDKRLVDYKAGERPLTGEGTQRIPDVLHNSRFVPYSGTRFFQSVNEMMDVPDPLKVTGEEYKKLRDDLFDKMPVAEVPMDQLVVTQRNINRDKIASLLKQDPHDPKGALMSSIQAVRYKGETYVLNGHHRAVAKALRGDKRIKANLLDLGDKDLTPEEIQVYVAAAHAKPELDKIVNDTASKYGATAIPSQLKSVVRARAKVQGDYNGDWSRVKDITRARITADSDEDVRKIAADLQQQLGIEPKVTDDPASGFRDYKFNPVIEGRKAEISVLTRRLAGATDASHVPYEKMQAIQRNANNERRALTASELAEISSLNNQMREIFINA